MGGEEANLTERQVESLIKDGEEESVEEEKSVEEEAEKPLEEIVEIQAETEMENTLKGLVVSPTEDEVQESAELEVERTIEERVEEAAYKPIKCYKKKFIGIIIVFGALLSFYFGMGIYFINHFYFGSEINGINISVKSVEEAEVLMETELQGYGLNLKERGGEGEQIKAADVGLRYSPDEKFKKLKESQNPFGWISTCFKSEGFKMTADVIYDEKLLKERIDQLSCFESKNIIEPKNASLQYVDYSYVVVDEIAGNKVDKAILYAQVADALIMREVEIDLEAINCYIEPQYNSKSDKIIKAQDTLNKYLVSKVTYTFSGSEEVLEGSTINKWLAVDENFRIAVDEKKVEDYIDFLSEKYNTAGTIRNFMASSGEIIQIGGGDFSRSINKAAETKNLISAIKKGETVTKEPVYGQTDISYGNGDIGDTYVEIDLTNQHIWFYKKGSLIVEGDIVTGNVRAGHTTPKGVYSLKYKAKNVVLRGPGYAAPVNFWMPFNGGIGMHDANWRSSFGGNIYKTDGSHGCINCPQNVASIIYNNIEPDTPVICY